MVTDKERIIAEMLRLDIYGIDYRTWLYHMGLRETHEIYWIGKHGLPSYQCRFRT